MKYRVSCRIDPPAFFGLPDSETTPIPYQHHLKMRFNGNFDTGESWLSIEGLDSTTRSEGEEFRLSKMIGGVEINWTDNVAIGTVTANSPNEAIGRTYFALRLLVRRYLAKRENSHSGLRIQPIAYEVAGQVHLRAQEDGLGGAFFLYDNLRSVVEFEAAADELRDLETDEILTAALDYFALGEELSGLRSNAEVPAERMELFNLRFLQYWKSLTMIIGDQTDPSFQSKHISIGLPREFFRHTVMRLKTLRDNHDVAHIPRRRDTLRITAEHVDECRAAAQLAINQYMKRLRAQ